MYQYRAHQKQVVAVNVGVVVVVLGELDEVSMRIESS